jgi:hypothetical protein
MGTDVYLTWKGMKDSDRDKQCTGFSIAAGDVGYLRASIGMATENAVLRALFPAEFWEMAAGDRERGGLPFDFMSEGNQRLLDTLAVQYLLAVLTGKKVCHPAHENVEALHGMVMKALASAGPKGMRIETSGPLDLASAVTWLNSLCEFYGLGHSLQEQGKEPRVRIIW